MTDLYLDEILALKLKEMSQTISSRSSWYKNIIHYYLLKMFL